MKPAAAYTLGLFTGLTLSAAVIFWSQRRSPAVATQAVPAIANSHSASTPPAISDSAKVTPPASAPATSPDSLESALREIKEAGMVVIPQEFARFLMPSLISTRPNSSVREILQLSENEAAAMGDARMRFDRALADLTSEKLRITEIKNGTITAVLPPFNEERQRLVDDWRKETLSALDADSATLFSYIELDRALSTTPQGTRELAITITPNAQVPDQFDVRMTSQTQNGASRDTYKMHMAMHKRHLLLTYPTLKRYIPDTPTP